MASSFASVEGPRPPSPASAAVMLVMPRGSRARSGGVSKACPSISAPRMPCTRPSPLFSTSRLQPRAAKPASTSLRSRPGSNLICSTSGRCASTASMRPMPLRLRSLSGLLIMAIRWVMPWTRRRPGEPGCFRQGRDRRACRRRLPPRRWASRPQPRGCPCDVTSAPWPAPAWSAGAGRRPGGLARMPAPIARAPCGRA